MAKLHRLLQAIKNKNSRNDSHEGVMMVYLFFETFYAIYIDKTGPKIVLNEQVVLFENLSGYE